MSDLPNLPLLRKYLEKDGGEYAFAYHPEDVDEAFKSFNEINVALNLKIKELEETIARLLPKEGFRCNCCRQVDCRCL